MKKGDGVRSGRKKKKKVKKRERKKKKGKGVETVGRENKNKFVAAIQLAFDILGHLATWFLFSFI